MKRMYEVFLCLLVCAYADAHTVTLTWTQSNSPGIVANKVYCGTVSGGPYQRMHTIRHPATLLTVPKVHSGTYYCMVTAVDGHGEESVASNEVQVVVP